MRYRPVLVAAPAEDPVTLEEVKAHLRVIERDENGAALPNEDDALITGLIKAAVTHLDGWTGVLGRCLVNQTWRQDSDTFTQCMRLPLGPVSEIVSVKYRNAEGQIATVAADEYAIETSAGGQSFLWFRSTYSRPSNLYDRAAVSVEFIAGYGAAADVPAALRHAIILMVQDMYRSTGDGLYLSRDSVDGVGEQQFSRPEAVSEVVRRAVDALTAPYRRVSL